MLVSRFLIERLENAGVKHLFGLPGEYVVDFYKEVWDNKNIQVVGNTSELFSAYSADAYARVRGVGCVVTNSVGATKIISAIQCAYAERSPVIVVSGAPGIDEQCRSSSLQKDIFEKITCASYLLDNPSTAGYLIDKSIEALNHYKQPIYLELPRDVAKKPISYDVYKQGTPVCPKTDSDSIDEALSEVCERILHASKPAILAGVEVARCDLGEKLIKFAERFNIPVASTLLSKSVVSEKHPLFAGVYTGASSDEHTKRIVEGADCLLMFGVFGDLPKFTNKWLVSASIEGLRIRNHVYTSVHFRDFCEALFRTTSEAIIPKKPNPEIPQSNFCVDFELQRDAKITRGRLFQKLNSMLTKDMAIISDMGEALVGAGRLNVHDHHRFLSPAFYTTLGWSIPASIGVQMANPGLRAIVLVGDAAFQTSCLELSTALDRGLNPIIIVLNNNAYTTERVLTDGDFNKVRNWEYHKICDLFGGAGCSVETEGEFEQAMASAIDSNRAFVINVKLRRVDASERVKQIRV